MSSDRLGIGFVGSGFNARFHIQSFVGLRDADVTGVWSPNLKNAAATAKYARELEVGDARPFKSIREMVADPAIDALWLCGPNHARIANIEEIVAAIRDRVGKDVKIRIDANMIWSVPAAIKWINGLERFDLQYVEQPVPDFDVQGLAQVRRAVSVPIAADEACTDVRSALELIKADACDVLVVYPSEAGGLRKAHQIGALADAAGKWCVIGSWAELGVATMGNVHVVAASSNYPFASDTHYPLQELDVLAVPLEMSDGLVEVPRLPGLGVELDLEAVDRLANNEVRESVFYDDIQGEAPRVGQIL